MVVGPERIEHDPGRRIVISIPSTYDAGDNVALSARSEGDAIRTLRTIAVRQCEASLINYCVRGFPIFPFIPVRSEGRAQSPAPP